jgi:hypothetical protein
MNIKAKNISEETILKTCDNDHSRVWFDTEECPLCLRSYLQEQHIILLQASIRTVIKQFPKLFTKDEMGAIKI